MPLSEEELRMLEQIERGLSAEDPKFVSTLRGTSLRRRAQQRALIAGVVFVLGVGILLAGAMTKLVPLGVAGFVVMLGSAVFGLNALRTQNTGPAAAAPTQSAHPSTRSRRGLGVVDGGKAHRPARTSGSFMDRMEARWQRRRNQQNRGF
ncbi:DUF3040 domain-containing protein [Nocardioides sp. GY 10127]|uniref:DUF3040 domain-containing protein n=1 Tax=Nocardioides sp. GY 10127 TaxID=2569762 RepID=UPI0010A840FA|nr:DUF3040 domain-containing protein [Nocardioides sp. GY 10127]TIC80967.1 DUF3040 domain-containing protein [Nocardioides sp. GY 10127]